MKTMNHSALSVPTSVVDKTLAFLRQAGEQRVEGVVLWLGRKGAPRIVVSEAYVPEQETACDYFRILPPAMVALLAHLGDTDTFIVAQVHSHPREAFHSRADDTWAIVRHLGAISLVVPHFARGTTVHNFVHQIAGFRLSATNVWQELDAADRAATIDIV